MATVILSAWHRTAGLHFVEKACMFRCLSSEVRQTLRLHGKRWQVSSEGRLCNTRGQISYGTLHASGYRTVHINGQNFMVHRLVKFGFHGPPPHELVWQVHHIDRNASNNRLHNLEYVTPKENMQQTFQNPMRCCSGPKNSKPVMWRAAGSQSWTHCESVTVAAKQLGMHSTTVSRSCRNGSLAKGFEMRFAEPGNAEQQAVEEWKPMKNPRTRVAAPDRMVSSLGRLKLRNGRISGGHLTAQGYVVTNLSDCGSTSYTYLHRLVAAAFLPEPLTQQHTQVNHKDGDKRNNRVENLEYVTPAENIKHRFAKAGTPAHKSAAKPVESRPCDSTCNWRLHASISAAANQLHVNPGGISRCIRGKYKHAGGYEFRLAVPLPQALPGEEWREVDIDAHIKDKVSRCSWWVEMLRANRIKSVSGDKFRQSAPCRQLAPWRLHVEKLTEKHKHVADPEWAPCIV